MERRAEETRDAPAPSLDSFLRAPIADALSESDGKEWDEEYDKSFTIWLIQHVGLKASDMKAIQESPNDWTFIINIHALIEVALNHMLAGQFKQIGLGRPEVSELIERFPLRGRTSKVAFARALGLMSKGPDSFINLVSGLRGLLVHDIKNFDFDLRIHLKTLKPEQLEQWKTGMTFNLPPPVEEVFRDLSVTIPHVVIWNGCMSILALSFAAQPLDAALLYRNMINKIKGRQAGGPADELPQTPRGSTSTEQE